MNGPNPISFAAIGATRQDVDVAELDLIDRVVHANTGTL
jgi:hypothetical protein